MKKRFFFSLKKNTLKKTFLSNTGEVVSILSCRCQAGGLFSSLLAGRWSKWVCTIIVCIFFILCLIVCSSTVSVLMLTVNASWL